MSAQVILGGWSPYRPLTAEDRQVFDEALNGLVGVHYQPNEVSTQVVDGMNYRFKCTASQPPAEVIWEAIIEVYQSPGGRPHIVQITRV